VQTAFAIIEARVIRQNKEPAMQTIPRLGVRAPQAAAALDVSEATFRRWVKAGRFPEPHYIGKIAIWPWSAIERGFAAIAAEADAAAVQARERQSQLAGLVSAEVRAAKRAAAKVGLTLKQQPRPNRREPSRWSLIDGAGAVVASDLTAAEARERCKRLVAVAEAA
jgi:predicted DNA-binding transcriptional regulator AlpA